MSSPHVLRGEGAKFWGNIQQSALPKEGAPEGRTKADVGMTTCGQAFQTEDWGEGSRGVFEAGGKPGGLLGDTGNS